MIVKLTAKSAKGKQRIKRDGARWTVRRVHSGVIPFAPTDVGPWLHIESEATGDDRWVRQTNDSDFIVDMG